MDTKDIERTMTPGGYALVRKKNQPGPPVYQKMASLGPAAFDLVHVERFCLESSIGSFGYSVKQSCCAAGGLKRAETNPSSESE
ncbi:hypothetical protein OUZ56_004777 [Daphnia magna]|uniref:Uncharacterized protein n=1 Tax=Daphnia magna TaxID=35525 RepID=A0ABQ9YQT9_9CRUS|nr:hypothetical protein OUZ56_004777 [Daphnia magna]